MPYIGVPRQSSRSDSLPQKASGELAILILAGGQSERLGCLKAFYTLENKPMIMHVFDRVAGLSKEIFISCKLGREGIENLFPDVKVVVDKSREKGPLAGLMETLPFVSSEYVAVLACDNPMVKPEVVRLIFGRARGHDAAILRWPNGYLEPLQAVYRTESLLAAVESAMRLGWKRLGEIVDSLNDVIYVSPDELRTVDPELESFANVNSHDDIARLRQGHGFK
jgi:molybdenum cofactor guanylyltransferase